MAKKHLPCPTLLRQLLAYEPDTGKLFWKERPAWMFAKGSRQNNACAIWNAKYAGREVATLSNHGYIRFPIFNSFFLGHRVAWAIFYGSMPKNEIDHINGDRADNRIANLRDVTSAENNKNLAKRSRNTSGATGVCRSRDGSWRAFITINGRQQHLGVFAAKIDAVAARKNAEWTYGFHQNHGR
jgi:hypothetical protein